MASLSGRYVPADETIRDEVYQLWLAPGVDQIITQRPRHSDDGFELSQGSAVQPLVEAIFPWSSSETVRRG